MNPFTVTTYSSSLECSHKYSAKVVLQTKPKLFD